MAKALKKSDPRDIKLAGCVLSATGLIFDKGVTFAQWEAVGPALERMGSAVQWWVGDWLNFGDGKPQWGDKYEQAISVFKLEYQTLADYKWVAGKFDISCRHENLSFKHHREVAGLDAKTADEFLDQAEPMALDKPPQLTSGKLRTMAREERRRLSRVEGFPPDTYRILYSDPPWSYGDDLSSQYGAADHHYSSLSITELCELTDGSGRTVKDVARDDAVLFMWVTSPLLAECQPVIDAWGFKYKTSFVWDKVRHNFGHYNSVRHELLLVCTRGSCTPDSDTLEDSVVTLERTSEHSRKPEHFRELIDRMYERPEKGIDRLELFRRGKPPEGWDTWGTEAT